MVSTMPARPEKFRIGRVLSDSFAVIGRNPLLCLWLVLIFHGLPRIVLAILSWALIREHGVTETLASRAVVYEVVRAAVSICFNGILQATLMCLAIEDLRGNSPSLRDCVRTTGSLLLPAIGIYLLVNQPCRIIGAVIGRLIPVPTGIPFPFNVGSYGVLLVLSAIPGIVLFVRWFVAPPVIMHERSGVFRSMARGRDLTKGSRWPLVGLWFVVAAAEVGIGIAVAITTSIDTTPRFLADALTGIMGPVILSLVMAASYVELRRLKEGDDADELAEVFA